MRFLIDANLLSRLASLLAAEGHHAVAVRQVVKTAQARLGHSDPRLTLAIYVQATTEGDRSAANKLGARLMGSANQDADASGSQTT